MATARFWVDELPPSGTVLIEGPEAKHINSVLRMAVGDEVIAFDGRGGEAVCEIESTSKRSVSLSILERSDTNRELPISLHLAVALPKGDRQRTLVEGLVQLGVTSLTPLSTSRGVAQPAANALERLSRYALEASKQSGRNTLMQIGAPLSIEQLAGQHGDHMRFVAHPYGQTVRLAELVVAPDGSNPDANICCAIGPEGGFTDEEIGTFAAANWKPVRLGKRILRVEMAAIMVASAVATQYD